MSNTIIRNDRTVSELQSFLFFCVAVAGKTGRVVKRLVKQFFADGLKRVESYTEVYRPKTPFEYLAHLRKNGELRRELRKYRIGQYTKLIKFTDHVLDNKFDVSTCTLDDLMACPGVGPKTARFYLLYTRPDQNYAVLDVHILRHLRELGHDAPESTPQSPKKYAELEAIVLQLAKDQGVSPVTLDDTIWRDRAWMPPPNQSSNQPSPVTTSQPEKQIQYA